MFIRVYIFIAVAVARQYVQAFTLGTMLPSYFCGPDNDGLPKTLGDVIANLHEDDAQSKIAGYHKSTSLKAVPGLVAVSSTMQNIAPGAQVPISVSTPDPKSAVLGLLIWAVDENGHKLGAFSSFPKTLLAPFPGCYPPGTTLPVGLVHITALDDVNTATPNQVSGLVWQAPAVLYTQKITFKGLTVTKGGFGPFSASFTTTGASPAPAGFVPGTAIPNRVLKCTPKGQQQQQLQQQPLQPQMAYATGGPPPTK